MSRRSLGFLGGFVAIAALSAGCRSMAREPGSGNQNGTAASGDASTVANGGGATAQSGGGATSTGGATNPAGASGNGATPTGTGGSGPNVGADSGGGSGGSSGAANAGGTSGFAGTIAAAGAGGAAGSLGMGGAPSTGGAQSTGGSDIRPFACAPPGTLSSCGNGIVDPGEQCDGADLRGLSCTTVDPFFAGGTLACATNCTLETGRCTHGTCGNGVVDPGEDCEPSNFTFFQCKNLPNITGDALVECSVSTCRYDLSNCSSSPAPVCGNGIRESGEQCDGDDWLWRACTEHSTENTGGRLSCDQVTCQLDFTQCTRCDGSRCGDGVINGSEQCDGTNLGTHSCLDLNRLFGTVSCLSNCNVDYSKCPGCTIFKGHLVCN